jgi:hypothetical protein
MITTADVSGTHQRQPKKRVRRRLNYVEKKRKKVAEIPILILRQTKRGLNIQSSGASRINNYSERREKLKMIGGSAD